MPFAALRAVQTVVLTAILVPCAYMTEPVQSSRDFPAVVTALNGGRNAPHWQKCPECGNRVARSYVYKHLCRQDGRVDNRKRSKPTPALSAGKVLATLFMIQGVGTALTSAHARSHRYNRGAQSTRKLICRGIVSISCSAHAGLVHAPAMRCC